MERRIEDNEYKITTGGGKEARFGVMIEYISHIRVGLSGGAGVMIYDWRNYEFEGEKMQLTRQFLSEKEMEMAKRIVLGKQDYMVTAARGILYKTALDDMLRRSFKTYLEDELKININVWMMQLRHMDDRQRMRDEGIMIGVVAEGSGERMSKRVEVFKEGKKKGMMMVDGIDLQLFRDVKMVMNTIKPNILGRADRMVEVVGPIGCNNATILKVLEQGGVSGVSMLVRLRQPIGKQDEMWLAIPNFGEKVMHRQVEWEGDKYILVEHDRPPESSQIESCCISYERGEKRMEKKGIMVVRDMESGSTTTGSGVTDIMSLSSLSSAATSMALTRSNEDIDKKFREEQAKTVGIIRDLVEHERREAKDMNNALQGNISVLTKQVKEQNEAQERARVEDAAKQNKMFEEMKTMMMLLMTAKATPDIK